MRVHRSIAAGTASFARITSTAVPAQAAEVAEALPWDTRKLRNTLNFQERKTQTASSGGKTRESEMITQPPAKTSIAGAVDQVQASLQVPVSGPSWSAYERLVHAIA